MTPGGGTPCIGTGSNQMLYGDVPNEYVNKCSKVLKRLYEAKPCYRPNRTFNFHEKCSAFYNV